MNLQYRWTLGLLILVGLSVVGCNRPATLAETEGAVPTAVTVEEEGHLSDPSSERPPAPDFTLETLAGETVQLQDYAGEIMLLNFWASWCPPCKAEMPDMQRYYEAYRDEGFVILGINAGEEQGTVENFVADYDITFPVAIDSTQQVMGEYGVTGLPSSFFVDREGRILGYWPGVLTFDMLEERLTPILETE
ncbi:MAG: TlpA family protein disulfide reductase [Anaerolineales bacterium]